MENYEDGESEVLLCTLIRQRKRGRRHMQQKQEGNKIRIRDITLYNLEYSGLILSFYNGITCRNNTQLLIGQKDQFT